MGIQMEKMRGEKEREKKEHREREKKEHREREKKHQSEISLRDKSLAEGSKKASELERQV